MKEAERGPPPTPLRVTVAATSDTAEDVGQFATILMAKQLSYWVTVWRVWAPLSGSSDYGGMSARRERRDGKKLLIEDVDSPMPRGKRDPRSARNASAAAARASRRSTVKPRLSRAGTRAIPAHMQVATRARSSFGASGASD